MEKLIIGGSILPSGNKNAALPLLAACLLTNEPVILRNLPEIKDVATMRLLLESLGVQIENIGNHTWRILAEEVRPADLDPDICRKIRASILLAGPMVARKGELHLPPPGGDVIGRRRVDSHILALQALGANAEFDRSWMKRVSQRQRMPSWLLLPRRVKRF
jgi:UDP-N-acetylglucosamine 1-carboxyvinyltransferase